MLSIAISSGFAIPASLISYLDLFNHTTQASYHFKGEGIVDQAEQDHSALIILPT